MSTILRTGDIIRYRPAALGTVSLVLTEPILVNSRCWRVKTWDLTRNELSGAVFYTIKNNADPNWEVIYHI